MRCSGVALLLACLLLPAVALADSDELAKGHYMAGQAYYNQARYVEAVREFEEAYRLSPKPELHYNIAQAYERMGNLEKTVEYLKRFLASGATIKDRTALGERVRNLEARLRQTGVKISSSVDGATVTVDGKDVGRTPLGEPVRLEPGSHEVRVSHPAYQPFAAFVSVTAGSVVEVKAALALRDTGTVAPPDRAVRSKRRGYTWTWVTAGTSAALLITCAVTGGVALKKASDAGPLPNQDKSRADSARTLALVSDVTLGVGLAAGAAAVVLFFYERKLNREQPATAVAPFVGPTSAGVSAAFSF